MRRPEYPVPERVVEVAVRVHDDGHRRPRQIPKVGKDLAGLDVRRARVDHERFLATEHDPDVLIEVGIPPDEDAVPDLDPAGHREA